MKILIVIAWRNLWRHTRRTVLTSATVALGLALLLLTLGLNDGGHEQMVENAVRLGSGHVVVQREGYQNLGGIERAFDRRNQERIGEWLEAIRDRFPVQAVAERVFGSGLASSASGATGVQVIGVQPSAERRASLYRDKLSSGEFLEDGDRQMILVGEGVARKLEVDLGDKVVLMGQAADTPEIQSRLARVKGILKTGQDELDQMLIIAPLSFSQDFFNLPDQVHQVAIVLEDDRRSRELSGSGDSLTGDIEVLNWREAMPELRDFIRIDDGSNYVFNTFLFFLIGFMVLNTLLMSVMERRREFSLLDALGLSPRNRFVMVLLEGLYVAAISCLAGVVVGFSAHTYFRVYGIPLDAFYSGEGELTAAGVAFDPILYSSLSVDRILQAVFWVFAMTLLLSLLPARRAARKGNVHLLGN